MTTPIALTIAGSDSGGGAGIQADLKTFSALGVYGASVITALTAQNTREVRAIEDTSPAFVVQQIETVLDDLKVNAIKIGMLSRPEIISAVADTLERRQAEKIVLDPVMVAKSGDALLQEEAVSALREQLLPKALVITPNLPEAAVLLGTPEPKDEPSMKNAAEALLAMGPASVLLKGGHLSGPESLDVFHDGTSLHRLAAARVESRNTHGTGCTLSSAIAAHLAQGHSLLESVKGAKAYITSAISAADDLAIGSGHGPVHHFHALWGEGQA